MKEKCMAFQWHLRVLPLLTAVLLCGCNSPHDSATREHMEERIANARTRADHQSLAQFFEREAQEARKRAVEHMAMSTRYTDPTWTGNEPWTHPRGHCETLASLYEKAEQENMALAALHRQRAAETSE
jgi:hypothetical protein